MQKAAQLAWSVLPNALFVWIAVSVFDRVHESAHKIEAVLGLLSKNMRTIAFLQGMAQLGAAQFSRLSSTGCES